MYNYKISKTKPGDNWFFLRTLSCYAWKSLEIRNYYNVIAPQIAVITAGDSIEDASSMLKDAIEFTIEECDIWHFEPTDIKEFELDKLPEEVVVFNFRLDLWVEMPELICRFIQICTNIPAKDYAKEHNESEFKDENIDCLILSTSLENFEIDSWVKNFNPESDKWDSGGLNLECVLNFKTQNVVIRITDYRYSERLGLSTNSLDIEKEVPVSEKLITLLDELDFQKLYEYLACTS